MLPTVMSSIMRRRRGLNWAIGNSCLRDGLQHPHPLRQETLTKSRGARRGSGFVQSQFRQKPQTLVLDLSVRSIVSPFVFLMPTAGAVFVLDRGALPWRPLLLRCSFRGRVSRLAGRKRLREDVADFIGPTPVVLDDRVTEMAHGSNLLLIAPAPRRPATPNPSGGFIAVLQWGLMARDRRTRRSIVLRDLLLPPAGHQPFRRMGAAQPTALEWEIGKLAREPILFIAREDVRTVAKTLQAGHGGGL